jgi:hypothetical protein
MRNFFIQVSPTLFHRIIRAFNVKWGTDVRFKPSYRTYASLILSHYTIVIIVRCWGWNDTINFYVSPKSGSWRKHIWCNMLKLKFYSIDFQLKKKREILLNAAQIVKWRELEFYKLNFLSQNDENLISKNLLGF